MAEPYNPIVRTFGLVRAELLADAAVDRREVRPSTPLEELLPPSVRPEFWRRLRGRGIRLPELELSARDGRRLTWGVVRSAISLAVGLKTPLGLLLILPLAVAGRALFRRRAVHFPLGLSTVGELVIAATWFREHRESGYRWTRNEIALKVRLSIAESAGLTLDAVRPELTWAELGFD